jgi:hypothetical protein
MGKHGIKGVVVAMAIGALALAPTATGGSAGAACLESAASACQPVGAGGGASKAKPQRARPQPRIAYDDGGQQVWRAGNRFMY